MKMMVYCTLKIGTEIGMEMTDCVSPRANKSGSLSEAHEEITGAYAGYITELTTSYLPLILGLG
jgi:hypothetical protein